MAVLAALKARARELRQHTLTVYYAARDSRTPFWVRLLAATVAAYALSPIDLIPDFIPVVGYLDDLVLIPLGLALVVRFTPLEVMASARERALHASAKPVSSVAAGVIVVVWCLTAWVCVRWIRGVMAA
ncbi:MAG: YkvA family protein [Lysobacterales bacterium]